MNGHVDTFIKSLIDPDIHIAQFPGNTFSSNVARQTITIDGSTYTDDGFVTVYQSNDGLTPICFSNRQALGVPAGSSEVMCLSQPVSDAAGLQPILEPLQYGNEYVLFSHPVTFTNVAAQPGYHFTVATSGLQFTVFTGLGVNGTLGWWHRDAGGGYNLHTVNLSSATSSYTITIPVGATAFGGSMDIRQANGNDITLTAAPASPASLTFGNHSAFTRRYEIPDREQMSLDRARILGNKVFVKYDGNDLYNGGGLAAAQFPPGTNPSQYPGATTYNQILASHIELRYKGHFKHGCVSRFVQPSAHSYQLWGSPLRFGENGFTVITWRSDVGNPQPYTITCDVTVEFTSHLGFIRRTMPDYAEPQMIADAVALLNRMQMISENPLHGLVTKLWDHAKHEIGHLLSQRSTWIKLAEIGAAALAI